MCHYFTPFMAESLFGVWIDKLCFAGSFIPGWTFGCFYLSTAVNSAAVRMHVTEPFCLCVFSVVNIRSMADTM